MVAKEWIGGDESAKEMLGRIMAERPFLLLLPPLHRLPLRVGNVVEIVGPSPSAKTHILIQAAISCILPKEWNGVHYGGSDRLVMYIDLDCTFDVLRLSRLLKHRINEANGVSHKKCQHGGGDGDIGNYVLKEEDVAYDEELYAMCMRRFLYTRCYDSFEFLATLKTLRYQCQKEREAQGASIYFLMIDSVGAFHWLDRASTCLPMGSTNRRRLSLQDVSETVVQEIQKLILAHPMLVLATKATILGDWYLTNDISWMQRNRSAHDATGSGIAASSSQNLLYREYMPSSWQSLITHRILLRPSDDSSTSGNFQDCSIYSSEWLLPPLSILDKFIVTDAGILTIS